MLQNPRGIGVVGIMVAVLILSIAPFGRADSYTAGTAPRGNAPPARASVGDGLGINPASFTDADGGDPCDDEAGPTNVTVIDPCGVATSLGDDWQGYTFPGTGDYMIMITVDDGPICFDDEPAVYVFSVHVDDGADHADSGTCTNCGTGYAPPVPGLETDMTSLSLRFALGTATDGESAGVLYVHEDRPSHELATPASLHYDLVRDDVFVVEGPGDDFQVETPQLFVDVYALDSYSYEVDFFTLVGLPEPDQYGYRDMSSCTPYKKWVLENPAVSPETDYSALYVTEYVAAVGGGFDVRVHYQYVADGNQSRNWTLTTLDGVGGGASVLRVARIAWAVDGADEVSTYTVTDGSTPPNQLLKVVERYSEYAWNGESVWLRTQQNVDPDGVDLETVWSWHVDGMGITRESVQHPDGSWTSYESDWTITPVTTGPGNWLTTVELCASETSGVEDESFVDAHDGTDVRSVGLCYHFAIGTGITPVPHLVSVRGHYAGQLVRATDYTYPLADQTIAHRWLDTSDTNELDTSWAYADAAHKRLDYVVYPDGRRDEYDYDDEITLNAGTPPTYNLGGTDSPGYHYRQVAHGYDNSGAAVYVANKSTMDVVIVDPGGLPVLEEQWVYTGAAWARVGWTARTYDDQHRLTAVDRHDNTGETISYDSCCTRIVTDSTGVQTEYVSDELGRQVSVTRYSISAATVNSVSYPAQAEIVTSYDYSTPNVVEITVAAGGLSQVTRNAYDGANRLITTTSGSGDGALRTLYDYGTAAGGGRKVTVYSDYLATASSGTPGVRDRITEYYADGRVKSVTGSTVVATEYEYGVATVGDHTETYTNVITGPSPSPRYETTYYDMLGRTARIQRPGWASGTPGTLTTQYNYSTTTGQLLSVETPGRADTLYDYDELGRVDITCQDVDDDGTIDYGEADRITRHQSTIEEASSVYWSVSRSWVYATDSSATETPTGSQWTRLTGFTGDITGETISIDALNEQTTYQTETDAANTLVIESTIHPDSSTAERHLRGGRLTYDISQTGVQTAYTHDALGRVTLVTDGRGKVTETHYDACGRVDWVDDEADNRTEYTYYLGSDSGDLVYPGRVKSVENARSKYSYYGYNDRGQTTNVWGDVPYPTQTTYDAYGQRATLETYRGGTGWTTGTWPASPPSADTTTWSYDDATGLLEEKEYDDSESVTYTYTAEGKLYVRTWARGVTTTYGYDANTGELTSVTYSDGTPSIGYTHDRLGRLATVTDATGERTFAYDATSLALDTETFPSGTNNLFPGKIITQVYEDGSGGTIAGRFSGYQVGTDGYPDTYYAAGYGYDAVGRLNHVTGPGLPGTTGATDGALYTYNANVDWIDALEFKDAGTIVAWTSRTYDADRALVTAVQNYWGSGTGTEISGYGYGYASADPYYGKIGLRTHLQRTGAAFAGAYYESYAYNDRSELTGSEYYTGTYGSGTPVATADRDWGYDNIGNRDTFTLGAGTGSESETAYTANDLNQYDQTYREGTGAPSVQKSSFDEDGNLTQAYLVGDVSGDGTFNNFDLSPFTYALTHSEGEFDTQYPSGCYWCADLNGDGTVNNFDTSPFMGLLSTGGTAITYTWDGENRLTGVSPARTPETGDLKIEFKYDYLGRRVEKAVYDANGSGGWEVTPTEVRRFMYDDWRMILELDDEGDVLRQYTWGLDLSGSRGGAGGIGGLLGVYDAGEEDEYIYFHDAQGNVGQVVGWVDDFGGASGSAWDASRLVATYEYAPYGEILASSGDFAAVNPFRFSTKYHDDETGLIDFGRRLYDPLLGRWINRDPIGEFGGANLYGYVRNGPIDRLDRLGLCVVYPDGTSTCDGPPTSQPPTEACPKESGAPTTAPGGPTGGCDPLSLDQEAYARCVCGCDLSNLPEDQDEFMDCMKCLIAANQQWIDARNAEAERQLGQPPEGPERPLLPPDCDLAAEVGHEFCRTAGQMCPAACVPGCTWLCFAKEGRSRDPRRIANCIAGCVPFCRGLCPLGEVVCHQVVEAGKQECLRRARGGESSN